MRGQIQVGLIGFGYAGATFHAPFIEHTAGLNLTHIVTSKPEKVAQHFNHKKCLAQVEALFAIKEIDLVVITAPNTHHFSLCKKALLAGKHVVCEKPFVIDSSEGEELIQIAQEQNLLLSVFQNRRYDNGFLTVQKILQTMPQMLGHVYLYEAYFDRYVPQSNIYRWREQEGAGSGILYDLGSHLIDQAVTLFGLPTALFADIQMQRPSAKAVDYFQIIMQYENRRVHLGSSCLITQPRPVLALYGKKGSYVKNHLDPQENQLKNKVDLNDANWGQENVAYFGSCITIDEQETTKITRVESERGSYQTYYKEIYDCLMRRGKNPVTPQSALRVIKLIELAQQSAHEKRWLSADFQDLNG